MELELIEKIKTYIELYEQPPYGCAVEGTAELLREVLDRITEYEKLEKAVAAFRRSLDILEEE